MEIKIEGPKAESEAALQELKELDKIIETKEVPGGATKGPELDILMLVLSIPGAISASVEIYGKLMAWARRWKSNGVTITTKANQPVDNMTPESFAEAVRRQKDEL